MTYKNGIKHSLSKNKRMLGIYLTGLNFAGSNYTPAPLTPALITPVSKNGTYAN